MADWDRLLIAKVVRTQQIQKLLLEGIKEDHFVDEDLKSIFNFCVDHVRKYRSAPSFLTVKERFPNVNFEMTEDSIDFLKDKFIKNVKRRYAIDAVRDLAASIDDEDLVGDIDALFLEKSRRLAQVVPSASISRLSDLDLRLENIYLHPETAGQGIKMGIPDFDNLTFGIQPHEYVTVMGPSGWGKSTLSQVMLYNAWLQNRNAMVFSLEMEANALFRKWDTMMNKDLKYIDLKSCNLKEEQKESIRKKAEELKERKNDILVMDDVRNCTPDRVYAELVRWQPDIACIDYISLMAGGSNSGTQMWEKVTKITQELKQISRNLKIPIIGVAQTNRASFESGATLDTVSHSISVVQDSDLILGLYSDADMRKNRQMEVRLLKNRDGATDNAHLLWDMENMEFAPWNDKFLYTTKGD